MYAGGMLMGRGIDPSFNPRTGKWTRPKSRYDKGRRRKRKKSGCFVATAVYGSYDCSQVWVLRRFRDEYLSNSWYGRAFISFYYAVSPVLVQIFGKTKAFNMIVRPLLDKKVDQLMRKGFSNEPYVDKESLI